MLKRGATNGQSYIPALSMALNCAVWDVYGVGTGDFVLVSVNTVGLALAIYFLYAFSVVMKGGERVRRSRTPSSFERAH